MHFGTWRGCGRTARVGVGDGFEVLESERGHVFYGYARAFDVQSVDFGQLLMLRGTGLVEGDLV